MGTFQNDSKILDSVIVTSLQYTKKSFQKSYLSDRERLGKKSVHTLKAQALAICTFSSFSVYISTAISNPPLVLFPRYEFAPHVTYWRTIF